MLMLYSCPLTPSEHLLEDPLSAAGLSVSAERSLYRPDVLPEVARGEQPGTQRAGCVLSEKWQSPERGLYRRAHVLHLPRDLGRPSAARGDQLGRPGREGSSAEGMGSHVGNTGRLAGRPGRGSACRRRSTLVGTARDESTPDLACRVQFSAAEGSGACDAVSRPVVVRRFPLEQGQNALGAVRGPCGDDAAVGLGQ
jgi:hypothetical protein